MGQGYLRGQSGVNSFKDSMKKINSLEEGGNSNVISFSHSGESLFCLFTLSDSETDIKITAPLSFDLYPYAYRAYELSWGVAALCCLLCVVKNGATYNVYALSKTSGNGFTQILTGVSSITFGTQYGGRAGYFQFN